MKTKLGKPNKAEIKKYLLSIIDPSGYDETPTTDAEKFQFVDRTFRAEYGHDIARYGYQGALSHWLSSLPSAVNIAFEYGEIITIAKSWGSLPETPSEAQQERVCEEWFDYVASQLAILINKYRA